MVECVCVVIKKKRFYFFSFAVCVVGFFRHQCSAASYLLPLVMVPTSVMGMFSGVFLWVFVGFLWDNDIKDFMKFMAGFSVVVTFILEFVCKYMFLEMSIN